MIPVLKKHLMLKTDTVLFCFSLEQILTLRELGNSSKEKSLVVSAQMNYKKSNVWNKCSLFFSFMTNNLTIIKENKMTMMPRGPLVVHMALYLKLETSQMKIFPTRNIFVHSFDYLTVFFYFKSFFFCLYFSTYFFLKAWKIEYKPVENTMFLWILIQN